MRFDGIQSFFWKVDDFALAHNLLNFKREGFEIL